MQASKKSNRICRVAVEANARIDDASVIGFCVLSEQGVRIPLPNSVKTTKGGVA